MNPIDKKNELLLKFRKMRENKSNTFKPFSDLGIKLDPKVMKDNPIQSIYGSVI